MNKFCLALVILFFSYSGLISAADVIISGTSPDWAGHELVFYRYSDLITESEKEIGRTMVNHEGYFELTIPVEKTTLIFTNPGIYHAYFYAEPGKKYELVLPQKVERSPADLLNPYFEPVNIPLGIINVPQNDINIQIMMFNDMYNPYYNKHVREVVQGGDFSDLDKDIAKMEQSFKNIDNVFFKNFRKYRYANLRQLALQNKAKSTSEKFFADEPVLTDNQAYMDLFHLVFDDYFQHHGMTDNGKKIYEDINSDKDLSGLKKTLSRNPVLKNDSLLELVILKCSYDEFYNDKFSRSGLIAILDTLIKTTPNEEYKRIGKNIIHEITKLAAGYEPPEIRLYDSGNNLVTLDQFKGKYVYLNFCTCSSYTCLKEFEMLNGIYQRHKDQMEIITVTLDPFDEVLNAFLKKNNYNWTFLYYGNQPGILKDYDIRAYPTYFLIGKDGKLIQSPAPGPNENFEVKLFDIMKSRGDL